MHGISPSFGGLRANEPYSFGEPTQTKGIHKTQLTVSYANGPVYAVVSAQETRTGPGLTAAIMVQKAYMAGMTYDFTSMRFYASAQRSRTPGCNTVADTGQLGVSGDRHQAPREVCKQLGSRREGGRRPAQRPESKAARHGSGRLPDARSQAARVTAFGHAVEQLARHSLQKRPQGGEAALAGQAVASFAVRCAKDSHPASLAASLATFRRYVAPPPSPQAENRQPQAMRRTPRY